MPALRSPQDNNQKVDQLESDPNSSLQKTQFSIEVSLQIKPSLLVDRIFTQDGGAPSAGFPIVESGTAFGRECAVKREGDDRLVVQGNDSDKVRQAVIVAF